jgi:hypothetical protein
MAIKVSIAGVVHTTNSLLKFLTVVVDALTDLGAAIAEDPDRPITTFLGTIAGGHVVEAIDMAKDVPIGLDVLAEHDVAIDPIPNSVSITGNGEDDLDPGYVLIDVGPFAIEVDVEELRNALKPFES